MNSWIEVISNPEVLSVYDEVPSLGEVELIDLGFHHGMDCVDVSFSLRQLPPRRSHRWPVEMNALSLGFQISGDLKVSLATAAPFRDPLDVHCTLQKHDGGVIKLECAGQGVSMSVESTAVRVSHLTGYIRATPGSKDSI